MTLYIVKERSFDGLARTGEEDAEEEVLGALENGSDYIDLAEDLWRLVDSARATELKDLQRRIAAGDIDEPMRLSPRDRDELIALLDGLEETLVGPVVDRDWRVPPDQAEELAGRVRGLDARRERPPQDLANAVGEGMIKVSALRNFLLKARELGCAVTFG